MRIQFKDPDVQRISHGGREYEKNEEGVFDVPHDAAQAFLAQPHLCRAWDGNPWPRQKTAEELEAERVANLVRGAMQAVSEAPQPRAKKRAAAKKKASAAKVSRAKKEPLMKAAAKSE